jgi:hypothetical protein
MHEIVRLVSPIAPEVQELEVFCYIVAGDGGHMEPFLRNEAKYMRKRPNDSSKTRVCLKKDDMDLTGNYLSHTGAIGLDRSSQFQRIPSLTVAIAIEKGKRDAD